MLSWVPFKALLVTKVVSLQYTEDANSYLIVAYDTTMPCAMIYKGTVPADGTDGFSITQVQNDLDKADWEANYKPYANRPVVMGGKFDPRNARRLGNMAAPGTAEVLISARLYNAQANNAQRSIKSSSAVDSFALGTGAKTIRLTYLTSSFVLKTEDIQTNGVTAVPTVNTDICYVESLRVIQGTAASGNVELWTTTGGTGTAICGIGAAQVNAFLCHHYVPAGMQAWVIGWGIEATHSAIFGFKCKLNAQERNVGTIDTILDLIDGNALPANARLTFNQTFGEPILIGEKCYIRPTVVPSIAASTVRGWFDFIEDKVIQ